MNAALKSHRLLMAAGVVLLTACAAAPEPPKDAFQAADMAIVNAERDRAAEYAPLEMRTAHEKLNAARASVEKPDDESVIKSRRLAEEARAEADLASAKSRLAKAEATNREMQKSSDSLRQETLRGSGG